MYYMEKKKVELQKILIPLKTSEKDYKLIGHILTYDMFYSYKIS